MDTHPVPRGGPAAGPVGRLRPAGPADLASYLGLRDAAARWLLSRGIDQWRPGEWAGPAADALAAGELWVLDDPGGPPGALLGGLILQWADPVVWPAEVAGADAGYVHGLVVDRTGTGRGLGALLLADARRHVREAGRRFLRLDCRAANPALRAYYADQGFTEVGERWRSWPGRPDFDALLALFEVRADVALRATPGRRPAGVAP